MAAETPAKPRPTQESLVPEAGVSFRGIRNKRHSFLRSSKFSTLMASSLASRATFRPSATAYFRSASTLSLKSLELDYFCDWFPELFGVDERNIPSSEEEGEEIAGEEEEEPKEVTFSQFERLGMGTDENAAGTRAKYGRRARAKPVLEREDGTFFECNCDIDLKFQRHHAPRFGGGMKKEGEEWRLPHFATFWQDIRDAEDAKKADSWLNVETTPREPEAKTKDFRPRSKLACGGKHGVRQLRREILSSLRPLDSREMRRNRMAFCEAVLLELEEDGYLETADTLRCLLIMEYHLEQDRDPCPNLRTARTKLNRLVEALKEAERRARKQERYKETMIICRIGHYFATEAATWWWLAKQLYARAVAISSESKMDGGKGEAIARYLLGTFLSDYIGNPSAAQEHLSRARELSLGKTWTANQILDVAEEPLHKACCDHLCRALIASGRDLRHRGQAEQGLPLLHRAYKLCEDCETTRKDIQVESLFELGMVYQEVGMLDWAKLAFMKFIGLAEAEEYVKRICDGHLELAVCYRCEGDLDKCHQHLKAYLNVALKHGDKNLEAFGNRYLGEFHLNNGNSEVAAQFFEKSFVSFQKQCDGLSSKPFAEWSKEDQTLTQDVELTRVLSGLAMGEVMTKPVCHLILSARNVRNRVDTMKLLRWKNAHESFECDEADPRATASEITADETPEQVLEIQSKESDETAEEKEAEETSSEDSDV